MVSEYKYIPLAERDPAINSETAARAELVKRMLDEYVESVGVVYLHLCRGKDEPILMCGWKTQKS